MDDQSAQDIEREKKRYLKRYRKNLACIRRLESKLDNLESKLKSIRSASLSGMPRGGIPVTDADLIADKVDLEARIERLKAKSRDLKNSVYEAIDTLEDPRYCEVLEAYFIDCLSIEEIAEEMAYTERHVYTLYKEAISLISLPPQ
jgi:predicted DNA-binding protein YlxM (UPF0122 family)